MFGDNKNIKDSKNSLKDVSSMPTQYQGVSLGVMSYTKTNKLVTALYMVTDIISIDEPIRQKLRSLAINMVSDISSVPSNADKKVNEILSLLDIAFTVNIISEMNCNILKKEFLELKRSLNINTNPLWLEEFMGKEDESILTKNNDVNSTSYSIGHNKQMSFNKGQRISISSGTRIGVQKGSTLLKALSEFDNNSDNFKILKNKRREDIISIIKNKKNNDGVDGATITDIVNGAKDTIVSCSGKTLQRELISMIKDNVLYKTGEKRWSRYFLKD